MALKNLFQRLVGNYISFAKAVAAAISIVGKETVQKHSFIHAHGSSTPANRTTESELIDRVAEAFEINDWPVTAAKAFVGHSLSTASGDQLVSALGTFKYDVIPGIKTITEIAPDVHQQRAHFALDDMDISDRKMQVAFINSKGFGGNNATAVVLSPDQVQSMLSVRHSDSYADYTTRREQTRANATAYADRADSAELDVIYRFGESLINEAEVSLTQQGIDIPGFAHPVEFNLQNPFADMQGSS